MQIAIPLFDRFTALDAVGPYEVLSRLPGAEVTFVGEPTGPVRTDTGMLAITIDARSTRSTPGHRGGARRPRHRPCSSPALHDWIARVHQTTQWTTSVCTGSLILGTAGLLDGLDATTTGRRWRAGPLCAEAVGDAGSSSRARS